MISTIPKDSLDFRVLQRKQAVGFAMCYPHNVPNWSMWGEVSLFRLPSTARRIALIVVHLVLFGTPPK